MTEKTSPGAPLDIAMGGRALLTPLTGIGQYAAHLAREFVQRGHNVRLFYGTHWSSAIADGRAVKAAEAAEAAAAAQLAVVMPGNSPQAAGVKPGTLSASTCAGLGASQDAVEPGLERSLQTSVMGLAKRFARSYIPGVYRFMPHVEQFRFNLGVRREAPQVYHDPNFIPMKFNGPTVLTAHDASWVRHPEYHPPHRLALLCANFPQALERADRVIVVSEFVRRELLSCFSVAPEKLQVVYNGVSPRFRPYGADATRAVLSRHGLVHGSYFVAVGTLEPRKNLLTALAAHARLPAAVRRAAPLVLIGVEGWLTDGLHAAFSASLKDGTVRKLGYVTDAELPQLTAGARGMVYPSIYEGFGLPVLEAMACGVPVLCSTADALREVVGDAGLLYDPADINGFAEGMQALLDDGALRERLIAAGLARAGHFSWQRTADETLDVYRQIVA